MILTKLIYFILSLTLILYSGLFLIFITQDKYLLDYLYNFLESHIGKLMSFSLFPMLVLPAALVAIILECCCKGRI